MATGKEQFDQQLREFLGRTGGSKYDRAAVIYGMIMEAETPEIVFGHFLEVADDIASANEEKVPPFFSIDQINGYNKEYDNLIDGILNKLVVKHCSKEEFYLTLWESVIQSDSLFEKKEDKIYALGRIWSDARTPYFLIDTGLKMSDEEFKRTVEDNKKLLQEISFILNCKYEQRTEYSSILLGVLDRCSDASEKAVIMASILEMTERKVLLQILNNRN